jgi:hypothetical protein
MGRKCVQQYPQAISVRVLLLQMFEQNLRFFETSASKEFPQRSHATV